MTELKIAVDLDGVVYDWGGTVRYLIKTHHGIDLPPSTHWDYVERNVPKNVWRWLWSEGVEEYGLFRYGHHLKGSVDGLRALADYGSLRVVTHRPRAALHDTLRFIENLPDVFDGVHFLTDNEPKSSVGCDLYIDDGLHVINEVTAAGKQGIVFDQPWNQSPLNGLAWRAWDWPDLIELMDYTYTRRQG